MQFSKLPVIVRRSNLNTRKRRSQTEYNYDANYVVISKENYVESNKNDCLSLHVCACFDELPVKYDQNS